MNGVLHKPLPSVCVLYVYVARKRLGEKVTVASNRHIKIEELLDAPFSLWPVLYQRAVDD
jgi:hypothetical protein